MPFNRKTTLKTPSVCCAATSPGGPGEEKGLRFCVKQSRQIWPRYAPGSVVLNLYFFDGRSAKDDFLIPNHPLRLLDAMIDDLGLRFLLFRHRLAGRPPDMSEEPPHRARHRDILIILHTR